MSDVGDSVLPAAHLIARNMLSDKQRKPGHPTQVELAKAISGITLNGSMKDLPNIQVVVNDPEWEFLESGFWDTDENGDLDPVDLNYPDGSRYFWRLTVVTPDNESRQVTMTFLDREVIWLMQLVGPIKGNRAKMTRAEFLKMLSTHVQHSPGIEFYSRELDIIQRIAALPASSGGGGSGGTKANSKGVINPIPNWTISQLDFGVDCDGPHEGAPMLAPAGCRIAGYIPIFYSGQPLVLYKFDNPLPGAPTQYWYASEGIAPVSTTIGHHFNQGETVATWHDGGTGAEIGWGTADLAGSGGTYRYGELKLGSGMDHIGPGGDGPQNVYGNSFKRYFGIP